MDAVRECLGSSADLGSEIALERRGQRRGRGKSAVGGRFALSFLVILVGIAIVMQFEGWGLKP